MDQTNGNTEESLQDRLDRVLWELRQPLDLTRSQAPRGARPGNRSIFGGF